LCYLDRVLGQAGVKMRRKLIAGNWKMNGTRAGGEALARELETRVNGAGEALRAEVLICPPATLLATVAAAIGGSAVALGGQDCHTAEKGAHTGDISAAMLADAGCRFVIVGHSERRSDHGESDALVRAKAEAALASGLTPIICVGETLAEREGGEADRKVAAQVRGSLPERGAVVLAYEPVWAIGTGRSAEPEDVAGMHGVIRAVLAAERGADFAGTTRILYGGSVKPENAATLLCLADVDGALVGGASLRAEDFWGIIQACP
jgi:triosephosphate isomerase